MGFGEISPTWSGWRWYHVNVPDDDNGGPLEACEAEDLKEDLVGHLFKSVL